MPTSLEDVARQTATTIIQQAAPAVAGAPKSALWQWALAIGLILVPFAIVGGVVGFLVHWYKKKSMLQIVEIFLKNGDIVDIEINRDASAFRYRNGAYELMPGRPHLLRRHGLFGFRRPVHLFVEGISMEQDLKTTKKLTVTKKSREIVISAVLYPGDDLANAKYLESRFDEVRSHKLFAPSDIDAFLIAACLAALFGGAILGFIVANQTMKCPVLANVTAGKK